MNKQEVNKMIQEMILSGDFEKTEIFQFVKSECQSYQLQPTTLGMLFELYADITFDEENPLSGFSREIPISELKNIHHSFESTNGCQWARSDNSYLGQRYKIQRPKSGGRVVAVKLDGLNIDSIKRNRSIRADIRKNIMKQNCRVLDINSNIEVDHKDGHYSVLSNLDLDTQKESDFQPLSKAANDAKRHHCSVCIKTGKRYDAKKLGYKESFIVGDERTSTCAGCYWYDPKKFNEIISQDFKKEV